MLPLSSVAQLQPQDFFLFRQEFAREVEKILPVSAVPCFWSPLSRQALPGIEGMEASEVEARLRDICAAGEPSRIEHLLILPLVLANGERLAIILQGIDHGLARKMDEEWLTEIRDQLATSLASIKEAHVHPETGLYTSRLLHRRLALAPEVVTAFFLVGAAHRAGMASSGLRQLAQTARLLETTVAGPVFYLGSNLFGVLQENTGCEAALHCARRLLGRLKREGLHAVHIGIAVRGEDGTSAPPAGWFAECWQALETAERRGPFSLCESSILRQRHEHPLARPGDEVLRQLRRGWRGAARFGLLLFRRPDSRTAVALESLLAGCLEGSERMVPVSAAEVYVFLPDAAPREAVSRGRTLKKTLEQLAGEGEVALGISFWPCLGYPRVEAAVNCRKALLHGSFLGTGALAVFDHLTLNISGDHAFDAGDYRQAVRDYQAGLRLNPGDVNLMNSLGVALAELNRQRQAIIAFDRVLASDPGNFMALANKGFALRMLGRQEEALACFEEVAGQSGFAGSAAFADISLQLGRIYCGAGRYQEALAVLERLAEPGPEQQGFQLYRLLGEAYAGVGQNTMAIQALQRAIRQNPHDAQSLSILGELYAREGQGDDIAQSLCLQALAMDGKPDRYWYRLAWVRDRMGADAGAYAAIKEALRRNRRDPEFLLLAGRICRKLGKERRAREMSRRLERLEPVREAGGASGSRKAIQQRKG